jgi:DNA-binding MarR family transcriptional regulator
MAAKVRQGNVASIGQIEIARRLRCSRTTVVDGIRQLVDLGHVIATNRSPRARGVYMLKSNVFGQKQRDGITTVVSGPRGRRMVTVAPEKVA